MASVSSSPRASRGQKRALDTAPPPLPDDDELLELGFICPITQDIFSDPVVAADGHTYERTAIEDWLKRKQTSPVTQAPLPSLRLFPNHTLKAAITKFQERSVSNATHGKHTTATTRSSTLLRSPSCPAATSTSSASVADKRTPPAAAAAAVASPNKRVLPAAAAAAPTTPSKRATVEKTSPKQPTAAVAAALAAPTRSLLASSLPAHRALPTPIPIPNFLWSANPVMQVLPYSELTITSGPEFLASLRTKWQAIEAEHGAECCEAVKCYDYSFHRIRCHIVNAIENTYKLQLGGQPLPADFFRYITALLEEVHRECWNSIHFPHLLLVPINAANK